MNKDKKTTFVYFDLGGVMFNFRDSLSIIATNRGLKYDDLLSVWKEPDNKACRGDITPTQMWTACGFDSDLTNEWIAGWTINKDVHELAEQVAKTCAVGILSNLYRGLFPQLIDKGLIPRINYQTKIISSDVGYRKPEVEIFEIAERQSGVKPEEIIFIDDLSANIEVAMARGWKGIIYDSNQPQLAINAVLNLCNMSGH